MIYSDSFFTIGKSHEVCEDYAVHTKSFAGISDGCSGAKNTDVGARLLLLFAEEKRNIDTPVQRALEVLPTKLVESLHATLLFSSFDPATLILNTVFGGDGFMAARRKGEDVWFVTHREFSYDGLSFPFYPVYQKWDDYFSLGVKLKETTLKITEGEITEKDSLDYSVNNRRFFEDPHCTLINYYDTVLVGSDGWDSFTNKEGASVPFEEVICSLLQFKNLKGDFVKRRMKTQLRNFSKAEWTHFDDLSLAGMHYAHSE